MMGPKQEAQAALFYEFSLEDHVPQDHLLRSIDRFVDLSSIRGHLADRPRYSKDQAICDLNAAAQKGRDALRTSQTHSRAWAVATTRALRGK